MSIPRPLWRAAAIAYTIIPSVVDGDDLTETFTLNTKAAVEELQTAVPEASTLATPATVANLTKGDGTEVFRHVRIGPLMFVYWKFTFGATSAVAGDIQVTLPVNTLVQRLAGSGYLEDVSDSNKRYDAAVLQPASNTSLVVRAKNAAGTYVEAGTLLSSTIPFTWATGDLIVVNAVYLAA